MKKFKNNKGITLVALIITIIVLLILAVVAISAVQGDGIIAHAKNARDDYQTAQNDENIILGNYLTELNNANGESGNGGNGSQTITDDLSATTSYVGYYADVDNDGTPDGVIFVDLMKNANNNQTTVNGTWNSDSDHADRNNYSYTTIETSKAYSVTTTNYTEDTHFGEHPIISVKSGSTGNDRFYVMALNDIDSNAYYWNQSYSNNNYSIGTDYMENNLQVAMQTSNGESIGKRNTRIVMQSADLTTNTNNLWNHISTQVSNGWFVPSGAEWSAFGDFMYSKIEGTKCSTSNYSNFGLSGNYWSSSQQSTSLAWVLNISNGFQDFKIFIFNLHVRLATTF